MVTPISNKYFNSAIDTSADAITASLAAIAKRQGVSVSDLVESAKAAGSDASDSQIRVLNLSRRLERLTKQE
jgi:hypothetical protein